LLDAIMAVADKGTSGGKRVWGVENHGHTSGLLDIEGVGAAGEFSLDGSLLDYEAKMDMPEEMAQMIAQYCAAVSIMFNALASSFPNLSGMN
jgi:roadblock/LC7 domain-containing protein